ncbi:MAG: membrane-associated phospholipid phosphatase [Pseudomonadota bacterium]
MELVHLGDVVLTMPAAAAITAVLLVWRAWRMAFWWSLLFTGGIAVVAASKIVFLGWGAGLPGLGFKALSGHAAGATAVFPTLFYLILHGYRPELRYAGVGAGIALGTLVTVLLIVLGHHSAAEALAGCALGALVSVGGIRLAGALPPGRPLAGLFSFALVFAAGTFLMQWAHLGWWMIKAARLLSGNQQVFSFDL